MFEQAGSGGGGEGTAPADLADASAAPGDGPPALDAATLGGWVRALGGVDRAAGDTDRLEQIRGLEELKSAAAAAQAKLAADFDASQRDDQARAGVHPDARGRGVASQVGWARRESPHRGQQHLGLAKVLVTEMPHTLAALAAGRLSEWRATLLVRETACLDLEHRRAVDRALAADTDTLDTLGDRQLAGEARRLAARLDPQSVAERARRAESERRVSTRPAPDTMSYLTALLPVAQAVAVQAALGRAADRLVADGDPRGRGQIMADLLVARATGQADADTVPVQVQLVMTLSTLFGHPDQTDHGATGHPTDDRTDWDSDADPDADPDTDADADAVADSDSDSDADADLDAEAGAGAGEPAYLPGYGPVPAGLARRLLARASAEGVAWWRRLFTRPGTGDLVAAESTARVFPRELAGLIGLRDGGVCRTPWCDAPIRHTDHVVAHDDGGPTSQANGQGLCVQCNLAKQAPGWAARPRPGPRHTVETTLPTGHRYRSTAPPPPGTRASPAPPPAGHPRWDPGWHHRRPAVLDNPDTPSHVEQRLEQLLLAS